MGALDFEEGALRGRMLLFTAYMGAVWGRLETAGSALVKEWTAVTLKIWLNPLSSSPAVSPRYPLEEHPGGNNRQSRYVFCRTMVHQSLSESKGMSFS